SWTSGADDIGAMWAPAGVVSSFFRHAKKGQSKKCLSILVLLLAAGSRGCSSTTCSLQGMPAPACSCARRSPSNYSEPIAEDSFETNLKYNRFSCRGISRRGVQGRFADGSLNHTPGRAARVPGPLPLLKPRA
uniref:Secreted protein n=1 Tax=Macrostomum lignano TaxID=282301 RepID=A0A1I8JPV9_9PLAT